MRSASEANRAGLCGAFPHPGAAMPDNAIVGTRYDGSDVPGGSAAATEVL
jgi:hypothetical protein